MRNWLIGLAFMPGFALAESGADTGDTAWILSATALVLFMTLPGLALFCGQVVQRPRAQGLGSTCAQGATRAVGGGTWPYASPRIQLGACCC